jgi:TPP-dependent pyruvate/acetoin dehydrogenase alpha subunit
MKKVILITIAVASLSTTALADARVAGHRTLHRHVVMGVGVSPALLNANASLNGNGVGTDHTMHMRNLQDSGYNPKKDFDSYGSVSVAQ